MILLLDAGNSHLKWAQLSEGTLTPFDFGVCAYTHLDTFQTLLKSLPNIKSIIGVAVCGTEKQTQIDDCSLQPITWQKSQKSALGITNHYEREEEHGPDRWFNVLGARLFCPDQPLIVVSSGTAITVDAITDDQQYLGGSILPGIHLMHQSLTHNTAHLNKALGQHQDFARNTADAIVTGIIDAACGAIDKQKLRLQQFCQSNQVKTILTGGNATILHPFLDKDTQTVDNLVLFGLARWVNQL
ncbi:type III pantothenate kinase [Neisseria sp. Ec49-e6-T10]|uniref:type III pantothenate kinase n=1 Tax=Neisseria sp. Ec49-e6-T10 TaxID=3140744 RepID=UPI003EB6A387